MRRSGALIVLAAALCAGPGALGASRPVPPRPAAEATPAASAADGPAHLLRPETFDRLSSGGRRLARALNGLPGPAPVVATPPTVRGLAPLAPPAARQNVRVNDPSKDQSGRTNSESSITVSGGNFVVGFNDASVDVSGYAVSTDGGATFTHRRLTPPSDGYLFGDPVLSTGPGGEVYYATLMSVGGGTYSTIGVAKSVDGGATFGAPVDAVNMYTYTDEFMDKPWLAVDASTASKYKGSVYVTWTYFGPSGETGILFARSTDGGSTFSVPGGLTAVDTAGVQGSAMAVGPAGELYVAWLDEHTSPPSLLVRRSLDGGATFGAAATVAAYRELTVLTGGGGVRTNSYPSIAVDVAGRLHVTWAAPPVGVPADRSDVFYSRSTDGGATFSAPLRVNDDTTWTTQAFPALAVTPGGRVAIRWIDRRGDPGNDALTDVEMAVSGDGGATFGRNFRVNDTSWAYGPVDPGLSAGYHGDYDGLAASGEDFLVTWSDERGSDPDVYFARVPAVFDPLSPDLSLTPSSPWTSVAAGSTAGVDLATAGTGVAGAAFSLSVSPAGPGVTGSISPTSVSADSGARLTLQASPSVPTRTDLLTVTAEGNGLTRSTVLRASSYAAGRPFGLPSNLTRTRGFTAGEARLDAAGRVHLLFEDDSDDVAGSEVFYARGTGDGLAVGPPVRLSADGAVAYDASLAVDVAGHVVAVWVGHAPSETTDRVWVARSSDGGATFNAPVAISPSAQSGARPTVAIDGSGNVVVAWYDFAPAVAVLYTARSTDGGVTFAAPVAIPDDAVGPVTRPSLAFDSKGAAYLVYTRQVSVSTGVASAARIAVAKDGKTFAAPASFTDMSTVASFAPDVAVAANDAVHVAYYTRVLESTGLYNREVVVVRSTDGGATFSSPVNVSGTPGQSWFPSIAAEPGGAITVAWEDDAGEATTDAYLARSTDGGATFSAPVDLSTTPGLSGSTANPLGEPGASGRVRLSVSGTGRLLVSWLDDSPGNPDVFAVAFDGRALSNRPPVVSISSPLPGVSVEAGVPVAFSGSGTDPDGDALAFSWSFGDARTAAGATPAAHPYARPGTWVATLTATDPFGATASASVTVTVTSPTASGTTLLLPVVLDTAGVGGSHFTSEVTLASRSASATEVVLSYTASVGEGSGVARLTLAPGEQRALPGVLSWLRQQDLGIPDDGTDQVGTLRVTFGGTSGAVFAGTRTFTPDPAGGAGTFGVFDTALPASTGPVTVYGLRQDASQRSNLALVNGGDGPVTLRVELFGPGGEPLGLLPDETLGPWGWTQISRPLEGKSASGRAVVTRVSGSAPFTAYGVLNDAVTSDGSFLPPLAGDDGSGGSRLVPVVLDVEGIGARFRTELTLANLTAAPLPLTLSYVAAPGFGSGSGTVSLTLAAGEQRIVPDAIAFLRAVLPIESDGRNVAGSLRVGVPGGTPASAFAAGARTYAPLVPVGTYGLFYAGLTSGETADGVAWVHALREDASERSNLALVHSGDAPGPITLRVSLYDGSGGAVGSPSDVTLGPGEWRQLGRPLLGTGASQGYARIERVSGAARFAAYGVRNDNVSADGSYVPMSK